MAMQAIEKVRDAELKATAAQDSADQQAHEIIEAAHRDADRIVADAKAKAAQRESAVLAEARAKADEMIARRREAAERDAAALREKTMSLRQNIINKLVEETLV